MRPSSNLYLSVDIERVLNAVARARGEGPGSDYFAALEAVAAAFGVVVQPPPANYRVRIIEDKRLLAEGRR